MKSIGRAVLCAFALLVLGMLAPNAHAQNSHQYRLEHQARMRRHHARSRHDRRVAARMYAREHRARIHRHRARVSAARRHHRRRRR